MLRSEIPATFRTEIEMRAEHRLRFKLRLPDGTTKADDRLKRQDERSRTATRCSTIYHDRALSSRRITAPGTDFVSNLKVEIRSWPRTVVGNTAQNGMASIVSNASGLPPRRNSIRFNTLLRRFSVSAISQHLGDMACGRRCRSKVYVVQTRPKVVQRCLLMTTDPGDLVLDITCGSGTTAFVAEQWGRRWMTCDTSRVALTLAKQRLMTAVFDYFQLAHRRRRRGQRLALQNRAARHAQEHRQQRTARAGNALRPAARGHRQNPRDRPVHGGSRPRADGEIAGGDCPARKPPRPMPADESVARSGETVRQDEWRSELLRAGIRGKGGQMIQLLPRRTSLRHALAARRRGNQAE